MKAGTLIVLVALAGAAVGGVLLVSRGGRPAAAADGAGALFPDLKARADGVSRVELRQGDKQLVIEKRGEAWVVAGKGGYPAQAEQVRSLVRGAVGATIVATKTSKPELYARLGVEEPDGAGATSTLLTMSDSAGVAAAVIIGKKQGAAGAATDDGPTTFVRRAGEAASLEVKGEFRVDTDALMWIDRGLVDLRPERVRSVMVRHGIPHGVVPPEVVRISRGAPEDKDYVLEAVPEGRKKKDDFVLTRLANGLAGATLDDVAPAASVDVGVADNVTAEYLTFEGLLVTLRLVKKDGKVWADAKASYEPPEGAKPEAEGDLAAEIAKWNGAWGGWVFQLPQWKADVLMSTMESVLAPVEVIKGSPGLAPGRIPESVPEVPGQPK